MYKGYEGVWVMSEAGGDILRPANIDEIIPDREYFMMCPTDNKRFFKMTLHPSMEWDNIVELVGAKRIYVRTERIDPSIHIKPPRGTKEGLSQLDLL